MPRKNKNGERPGIFVSDQILNLIKKQLRTDAEGGKILWAIVNYRVCDTLPEFDEETIEGRVISGIFDTWVEQDEINAANYRAACKNRQIGVLTKKAKNQGMTRSKFIGYMQDKGFTLDEISDHINSFPADGDSSPAEIEYDDLHDPVIINTFEEWRQMFPQGKRGKDNDFPYSLKKELYNSEQHCYVKDAIELYMHEGFSEPKYCKTVKAFFSDDYYLQWVSKVKDESGTESDPDTDNPLWQ